MVSILVSILEPLIKFLIIFINNWCKKVSSRTHNFQEDNDFTPANIELSEKYFDMTVLFFIGIIGAPFCPLVLFLTLVGLIIMYWTFKYLVIYKCRVEPAKDEEFVLFFLRMLTVSSIFFSLGSYYNARKLQSGNMREDWKVYIIFSIYAFEILIVLAFWIFRLDRHFIEHIQFNVTYDQIKQNYRGRRLYDQIEEISDLHNRII